jgi:hypothetical protein
MNIQIIATRNEDVALYVDGIKIRGSHLRSALQLLETMDKAQREISINNEIIKACWIAIRSL